ncbi:hypothetical protein [Leptothoe spongobia]|uniref:Uncharacterized protein n=1 Tax=Leptothoe spongobia TAU-MAC 1115 TaxID=1967444 RepID=A0A947DFH8_9CYAN|nr:hypothetical protein [Leptothoe spongobia]MBT9315965.1 hypothetical protein [Leptothoe spongobia TAU-MAC 1115]
MANPNIPFSLMRIPLILSGLVYLGLGAGCFALPMFESALREAELPAVFFYGFGIFCVLLGLATIIFACILHKPNKAIYIIALIITILYIPSAYIFFGIPMVIFLLRQDVRNYYGINL